ncbi:MAG: hypothetical protein HYZ34_12165 [Ignavibacteriae bacterium]|nr:hypothetical protein [Ignavibacteriota bacterium]
MLANSGHFLIEKENLRKVNVECSFGDFFLKIPIKSKSSTTLFFLFNSFSVNINKKVVEIPPFGGGFYTMNIQPCACPPLAWKVLCIKRGEYLRQNERY